MYEEALKSSRPGTHTSHVEVSTNSRRKERSGILDLRDIQHIRPNTRYVKPTNGTFATSRDREASGDREPDTGASPPGEDSDADGYIRSPPATSGMVYRQMSAGPNQNVDLTHPRPTANVSSRMRTPTRSTHASGLPHTSHKAIKPHKRRTPASFILQASDSPPAYSTSTGYSTRNIQTSSRRRRATAKSDSDSEDDTAELERAFRRLSNGARKQRNERNDDEVFEGRGQGGQ